MTLISHQSGHGLFYARNKFRSFFCEAFCQLFSSLPVVRAADLMEGKGGSVHAVLRTGKLCQVRAAPSQHAVAIVLQTQTEAPVVLHQ